MKPFVKWAGGKEKEIKFFSEYIPTDVNNYIEPFLGGGAVFFYFYGKQINGKRYINDYSDELISLYRYIENKDQDFYYELNSISDNIELMKLYSNNNSRLFAEAFNRSLAGEDSSGVISRIIDNLFIKETRLYSHLDIYEDVFVKETKKAIHIKIRKADKLQNDNHNLTFQDLNSLFETSLHMALYNTIRFAYNSIKEINPYKIAYFLYLREYCFSSMFRYNGNNEFNVPYGGMSYNKKMFSRTIEIIQNPALIDYLNNGTQMFNEDFESFLNTIPINEKDFIFCDPPYDSEFSEYAQMEFSKSDQSRLADCLKNINARIMIVIKETPFIRKTYEDRGFFINTYRKKYNVNFQNRNDRDVNHLIITNYRIEGDNNG